MSSNGLADLALPAFAVRPPGSGVRLHVFTVARDGVTHAGTTDKEATPPRAPVPVFNGSGGEVGVAVTNQATGAAELIAPGGGVLGVIEQQGTSVNLIGAGGTVAGTFSVSETTGQVILSAGVVPVFDVNGSQIGLVAANPVTGTVELVGTNGIILGVIVRSGGLLTLAGAGGAVLGSFGVNPATGQDLFVPASA